MGKLGTALAHRLSETGRYKITFYTRDENVANSFNHSFCNPRCFSDYKFTKTLATNDLLIASQANIIFLTVASKDLESIAQKINLFVKRGTKIIICSKGISNDAPYLYTEILKKIFKKKVSLFVLSGPNFADEIIENHPTITTIAGKSIIKTSLLSLIFRGTNIKTEITNDIVGVQIFGAMKNIMAITVGILEGLGYGKNTTIKTIMYFVKETQFLNKHYNTKKNTAYLSAGIGDIMLTCFGDKSRNRQFGLRIGKGESVKDVLQGELVEGYYAVNSIRNMSHELKRLSHKNLSYINTLYDILYNKQNPKKILEL